MNIAQTGQHAVLPAYTGIALLACALGIALSGAGCDTERKAEPGAAGAGRVSEAAPGGMQTAYFAGGCFWGIEHYFQKGPGVVSAASGYMQGRTDNPTYDDVVTDTTGHAEAVK